MTKKFSCLNLTLNFLYEKLSLLFKLFCDFAYPEPAQKFRLRIQQKVAAPPAPALQHFSRQDEAESSILI
jgi:hypothetical protein